MKERPREVKISLLNAAVLLRNIYTAASHGMVGFVDADKTLESLAKEMQKDVWFKSDTLESALYYTNMLAELEEMWHPQDIDFNTFIKRALPTGIDYDRYYGQLSIKEKQDV